MRRWNPRFRRPGKTVILVVALTGLALVAYGQEPKSRAVYMRQKLELSKGVLEGLTTENFDLIDKNAKLLKKVSMAAEWEVTGIPNAEQYLPLTAEFQRLCDDLSKTAKNKNLDGATLSYVRLTTNCVSCHKYVRDFIK